jgi:hypothetical protein
MEPRLIAALVGMFLAASTARGEIYEWTDAAGARHFTNRSDLVPADRREGLRVIVPAGEETAEGPSLPATAPPEAPPAAPPVVADRTGWRDGYEAGLSDGWAMRVGAATGGTVGQVNIVGPLAVSTVEEPPRSTYGSCAPWFPYYYPFVTTSFDRGRSRHLTLRMLLQDQFQIDRDGPFVYERLNPPGIGPNLHPFLPRGLPGHYGRYTRGPRVLFR